MKFYTDDSVMLPADAPLAEGHDAIAKVWRGYFDLPDFSLTFSPTKINVSSSQDVDSGARCNGFMKTVFGRLCQAALSRYWACGRRIAAVNVDHDQDRLRRISFDP